MEITKNSNREWIASLVKHSLVQLEKVAKTDILAQRGSTPRSAFALSHNHPPQKQTKSKNSRKSSSHSQ